MEEVKDSVAKGPEGLWPGERIFASDIKYWRIAGVLWLLGWVLLSALLWKISALVTVSYLLAFLTWLLAFAFQAIPENKRAKPVLFGVIGKKISWGAVLVLAPFEKLVMFPTGIQQVSLTGKDEKGENIKTRAGIQTKAGEEDETKRPLPSIVLPVEPVFNFRWPSDDDDLTEAIKNAPPPDNLKALKDIIEEPMLDIIRTVGGKETFLWALQNRTEFAAMVNEFLRLTDEEIKAFNNPKKDKRPIDPKKALAYLIYLARLRDVTVSFKHMEVPDELKKQQIEEAAAVYKGEAAKIIKIKEGQGKAEAEAILRTAILDVLVNEKYKNVAVMLEQMKALVDASQGSKATLVIPADILNALGSALSGSPEKTLGMSQKQFKVFAAPILEQLLKEQLLKQGKGG